MTRVLAAVVAVVALPLASCSGGSGDDDTYLLTLEGRAEVEGGERLGEGEHRLEVGQVVRVTFGTATLGLPGRRTLELQAGADPADDSRVEVAEVPTLVDGHALLVAGNDETARLRSGTATIALRDGAARVRRSTGVNLAVYEGTAEVEALGRGLPRPVGAFRQVAVADTGALPRRAVPLVYDRDDLDPWDRRFLGAAIDLGSQLDRASLALNRRLAPPPAPGPDYFRQLVPGLRGRAAFGSALLEGRRASVGEMVVGASIVLGAPGPFARRWTDAFQFREEGADWGLVALDQRARRGAVLGVLDGILDAVAASLPAFGASPVATGGVAGGPASPRPTSPGGGDDGGTPVVPGLPAPGGPTPPTLPPITVPLLPENPDDADPTPGPLPTVPELPPGPAGGLLAPVTGPVTGTVNGVVETVEGLLGSLAGPLLGRVRAVASPHGR